MGADSTLENLLKVAISVFYNRDQEETQEREKRLKRDRGDTREMAEALMAALQA